MLHKSQRLTMRVKTTIVYEQLSRARKRIAVMQGGTRSGKTWNILLFFIIKLAYQETGKVFTVCRASLPTIKGTVLRDFIEILLSMGLYSEDRHNKTDQTYELNGNLIEFISADQPQKIRGRKRDYLFINEANELTKESWMQLLFRTSKFVVLDYNPSDEFHWIYDDVLTRDDVEFFISTYRDNPFLSEELVKEIERLELADPEYWKVYGLGERGSSANLIYTHWKPIEALPGRGELIYGVDFGFVKPTAVVGVEIWEGAIYADEIIYQDRLTTPNLADEMLLASVRRSPIMYCDSAEPKTIEELRQYGWNTWESDKSVLEGIKRVKSMPLYITTRSTNMVKEIKNYRWVVDKNGVRQDEPVKNYDHSLDALRYAIFTHLSSPQRTWTAM
jgi:phage terminase large subunit